MSLLHRQSSRFAVLLVLLFASSLPVGTPAPAQERLVHQTAWWVAAGTLLGISLVLDERLRSFVPEGGGEAWDPLTDHLNILGNPRYLVPVIAGGAAGGTLLSSPQLASSSAHVLAGLLAAGVANGALKSALGRERPVGGDPRVLRPFSLDNRWQSFPSGHATVAFSIATGLSVEAGRPWVSTIAYSTAALVGWSRVYEDKHWGSDVVGGALVGIVATRAALRVVHTRHSHDRETAPAHLSIHPGGWMVRIPVR